MNALKSDLEEILSNLKHKFKYKIPSKINPTPYQILNYINQVSIEITEYYNDL